VGGFPSFCALKKKEMRKKEGKEGQKNRERRKTVQYDVSQAGSVVLDK